MRTLIKNVLIANNNDPNLVDGVLSLLIIEDGRIKSMTADLHIPFSAAQEAIFDTIIDGNGTFVLPGLIDSHIHVGLLGESLHYVNLIDCYDINSIRTLVKTKLEAEPDLPFIIGFNWDQTKLGTFPTRLDLDDLTDKPIFLWRACWHIGVANTATLKLANLFQSQSTASLVEGGAIDYDTNGMPTGVLLERAVEPLIAALTTYKTAAMTRQFLREGLDLCVRNGITMVQSNDERCLEIYQSLQQDDLLPIRVMLTPNQSEVSTLLASNQAPISLFDSVNPNEMSSRLGMNRVKIFSDGSLGAETAAIRTNTFRSSSSSHKGILIHDANSMEKMIYETGEAGYRVEIHAIGDAAAEQVLTAMKHVKEQHPDSIALQRPILTHCQVLGEDLITMMKDLDVIANVQPSFVLTDMRWVMERMQPDQIAYSYAWKTLLSRGIHVAGGSDAPIEHPSPFTGMYDAIYRTNAKRIGSMTQEEVKVFRPEECLTFSEALRIYTEEGEYASGYEHDLGRIAVGYAADLVLVDPAIRTDHTLLHGLLPKLVIVGGIIVHKTVEASDVKIIKEDERSKQQRLNMQLNLPSAVNTTESKLNDAVFIPGKGGHFKQRNEQQRSRMGYCRCLLHMQYCGAAAAESE